MSAKTKPTAYERITAQILDSIAAGVVPWRRPWDLLDSQRNAQTGRPYSGINALVTAIRAQAEGWTDPRWTTYNAAKKAGGQVRRGERGTHVLLIKQTTRTIETDEGEETTRGRYATSYVVFNVEQVDGLDLPDVERPARTVEPHTAADRLIADYLAAAGPKWTIGGDRACYAPLIDEIRMPRDEAFHSDAARYHTAFHEIGHSTGHVSRLDRDEISKVTTTTRDVAGYALEELVAELTASYLAGHVGLELDVEQTAAYVDGWHSAIKRDPRMMVTAASRAYKAADLVVAAGVETADQGEEVAIAA